MPKMCVKRMPDPSVNG